MAKERFNDETGFPERRCEDCSRWLTFNEFPTSHRTWVCKVCQGLKAPPKQRTNGKDVGYKSYLESLQSLKEEKAAYQAEVQAKLAEFEKRRLEIVREQYAKYEKPNP